MMVSVPLNPASATVAALLLTMWGGHALAEDRGAWFKSLKQPGSAISCCDVSDCRRAPDANWQAGQWHTTIEGEMTPIPNDKVVRDPPSIDGAAYVCAAPSRHVYCFIPPSPGS